MKSDLLLKFAGLFGALATVAKAQDASQTPTPTSESAGTSSTGLPSPLETSPAPVDQVDLRFNLTSGSYDNYFIRSNLTAAQVLLTNTSATELNRFLVAFPAGNSGAVSYFLPLEEQASLNVTLGQDGIRTAYGPNDLRGVAGELLFSNNATLGTTLLGSIRTVRDYTEGNGLTNEIFNWTVSQADNSTVWLSRAWLNETILRDEQGQENGTARYGLEWLLQAGPGTSFNVTPSNNGTYTPPRVDILVADATQGGSVNFTVQTNETNFAGLTVDQLFSPNSSATGQPDAEEQFSFLTFTSKFTAGGWRFITYFGRDTMFTTRLLMNNRTLTPFGVESVLGGVLERINATSGQVCHEETIGDYATFVNINEGFPERGNEPVFDYKMKDTHYVLLPQLADYLIRYNQTDARANQSTAKAFLDRPATLQNGTTYRTLLEANVGYVMNTSRAFAEQPEYQNLARIQDGIPVGNWRDSNPGLGWGVYPYDVSTALVPAALYAIADLAAAGLLEGESLETDARRYAQIWETEAPRFFQVDIPTDEVQQRLDGYVERANLTDALLYGRGSLNDTSATEVTTSSNVSVYGLSLLEDGTPVPVQNSDLGFNLLYNRNISRALVEHVITALSPYPRGLLTNVGMLISNPAYDTNVTKTTELDRTAYHGTVSWGWQTAFMASGLARVIASCADNPSTSTPVQQSGLARPDWCDDADLVDRLTASEANLWHAINGAFEERFAEVWSWTFNPDAGRFQVTPLGDISPEGTESNAIQLWSYGLLGLQDPTAGAA